MSRRLSFGWIRRSVAWVLIVGGAWQPLSALTLRLERAEPHDLEISGGLAGVPAGESRFASWAALRTLSPRRVVLDGEFVPGPQEVTIIDLARLWQALPVEPRRDTLLAWCTDGFLAVYRRDEVEALRPFVVLEINGRGPGQWPPEGLAFNPGPYAIGVDRTLAPAVADLLSETSKKPWGVARVEFVRYAEAFAPLLALNLSEPARQGREVWLQRCVSCHEGPPGTVGGTKAARRFALLSAQAAGAPDFFLRYVKNPRSINPAATMEANESLDVGLIEAVRRFLAEGGTP